MILGIDASTRTVGWAVYDGKTILDAGFIDISKIETNKEKVNHVIEILEKTSYIKQVDRIHLEAALSGFMRGRSSQQTVILLARFNAVFEYIISEHWKLPVQLLSVTTARKAVFGKCRIKGVDPKVYVKNQLSLRMDLTKFDKLNKLKDWDQRNSDTYDAIVMAMVPYQV